MYRTQSFLLIPLIMLCLNKSVSSFSFAFSASMGGLFWGLQILAGAPQDAFYSFLAAILFIVFHLRTSLQELRWNLRLVWIASLFFFIGSGIAANQIVPSFDFIC